MPLSIGDKLGHYEVLSVLGQGGMGEVYRAHDPTLKRDVALKVLPTAFLRDPERMARFQREAEVLASLDHPNIGPIYGLVESEGARALVLALVEGPTLADRLKAGPLAPDEALAITKQIIEALEYAHDRGVVHRDLKPANVKITPEGVVKVLDFGLAKVLEDEPPTSSLANSPTLTLGHTRAGMILGTAAYMSPEQAVGRPVDRRSDIFSFGAVLYEMLAGKGAFAEAPTPDVLEAVVKNDPDWSKLPAETPSAIDRLVRRCLVKDRKQRLQAIGEARIVLDNLGGTEVPLQAKARATTTLLWILAAAMSVVPLGVATWALWPKAEPPKPLVRLDVDLGADVALASPAGADEILSPDGTRIVYVSQNRLFTRRLDQPKAAELAGTEGAFGPFFSPDGRWVAFFASNKLKKISVDAGAAVTLCDAPAGRGGAWGEDGVIIATLSLRVGLSRIPDGGGRPTPLTELAPGEVSHRWPHVLPGGKAVLFASSGTGAFDEGKIEVLSLADHRRKTLVPGGAFGRYLASHGAASGEAGHLLYVTRGTLFAVPFDPDHLEVHGTPVPEIEGVAYSATNGSAQVDVARNGTLIYRGGATGGQSVTVQWLDAAGRMQPLSLKPDAYDGPSLSPDGKRLALRLAGDAWVYEELRGTLTRVSNNAGITGAPIWSPDGRYLAFGASSGTGFGLYWTRSDGAGTPQQLSSESKNIQVATSFAPDGRRIALTAFSNETSGDLATLPVESDGAGRRPAKPEPFLRTPANEVSASFSADGRWLAYESDDSGTPQVYVRAFPDKGGKWQISNSGGQSPIFARTGRELFYRIGGQIMVAAYTAKGDTFLPEKPRAWSAKGQVNLAGLGIQNYDVARDGQRIVGLFAREGAGSEKAQSHVVFLLNFSDELRRRVPQR